MKKFTKIRIRFDDESLLDFDQVLHELQQHYAIGFAGLCKGDQGVWLYIQRDINTKTSMTLGKIRNICSKVAVVVGVEPFNTFEDELIESYGTFRHVGARGHLSKDINRKMNAEANAQSNAESNRESKNTTKSHNTTNQNSNNSTSSHNTTTNIHLHINALGKEDTSHITKEVVEGFVGTADQLVRRLECLHTPNYKHSLLRRKWPSYRMYARQKVRRWDKQQRSKEPDYKSIADSVNIKPPTPASEADDEEYDHQGEILTEPPLYDPDSDSEFNKRKKRECLRLSLLEEAPSLRRGDFLRDFEDWIYENPHNSNVIASTKEGYFKYFNGKCWTKLYNTRFFEKVTASRILKLDEFLNTLIDQGELSEFCRKQVSQMVNILFGSDEGNELERHVRDHTETTKDGILAAENQEARLAAVAKSLQQPIVRVGKVHGGVIQNSTWEELENM